MNSDFIVSGKEIGPEASVYLIAEVGTTHGGDINNALALVEKAAKAGMDAVKFQIIDPYQDSNKDRNYHFKSDGVAYEENMQTMFMKLQFNEDEWDKILERAKQNNICCFATVDSVEGIELLEKIKMPAIKMGAWDTTYIPLIKRIAETGLPTLLDLGPTTEEELKELINTFEDSGGKQLALLHDFHTEIESEMNMRAIEWLSKNTSCIVGYSSPARDDDLDILALGLGVNIIEKRLILSRSNKVFHADQSLEPEELKAWVQRVRRLESTLGKNAIIPSLKDAEDSKLYYRSVCTLRDIKKGEIYTEKNLIGKRPGTGIHTRHLEEIWGKKAVRDIKCDSLISWEDIE